MKMCELVFSLPEFSRSKKLKFCFHRAKSCTSLGYDAIAGTDFLAEFGIKLDFENGTVTWDHVDIEMPVGKSTKKIKSQKLFLVEEPIRAHQATKRVVRITALHMRP